MSKPVIKKIFLVIYTTILALLFGYATNILIGSYLAKSDSAISDYILDSDVVIILILLLIFSFWYFVLYKLLKKFTLASIIIVLFLVIGGSFLFKPYQVKGNVGNYKDGEIVLAYSRKVMVSRPVQRADIVVFSSPGYLEIDGIGIVLGIPGDNGEGATYYSGEEVGTTIPSGFYLINFGGWLKVVPESNIKYMVWFPIRDKGPIQVRNPI